MLTRMLSAAGLIVRIAEYKASLAGLAAGRSAFAVLGSLIAGLVALGGLATLSGAGYIALEAFVGGTTALAVIGGILLLVATVILIIANRRGSRGGASLPEKDARKNVAKDEEMLRSMLGMNKDEPKNDGVRAAPRTPPTPEFDFGVMLNNPKLLMAAGIAMLGLLGPGRMFRTVRLATAIGSIAALANRVMKEQRETRGRETQSRESQVREDQGRDDQGRDDQGRKDQGRADDGSRRG